MQPLNTMPSNVIDPEARDKYLLQVTAGSSYDTSQHQQVSVNGSDATNIESDILSAWLRVRIRDYHGLPLGSPASSKYFEHPQHKSDRYSVAYSFVPKKDMSGSDLVMGFDYGHSIKHQLPPGFNYAMKIATSLLDPGLYADAYCDEPYLYGPALSSFFAFRIGETTSKVSVQDQLAQLEKESDNVIEEGAEGSGKEVREASGMPPKWKKRRKYFLNSQALANFTFEKDRVYHADFFNPHLDFANFSLRLPGFSISVAKYVDDKTHHLRYVLRNRRTEEVLFVVFFKLLFGKELDDTLEQEKSRGSAPTARENTSPANGPKKEGTGHDELTKVCAAEEAERQAEQRTSQHIPSPEASATARESTSEPVGMRGSAVAGHDGAHEDQSYIGQASSAASSLANTVTAVYAALGFGNSSSSTSASDPESSSRNSSPHPRNRAMAAKIDGMDDETVERYLQSKQTSS
ncbi:f-box domain containing [Pyrenophora seminiperda CCB06]|uniref:F-box domain containing n=1 Tax=Pyrenophora seminiperda CCB06 TaxID=1302712 RepID=A0A3M7M2W2_9PLEO|nr:f-box domain containing [Pyrenophora seminiperda CCB06]